MNAVANILRLWRTPRALWAELIALRFVRFCVSGGIATTVDIVLLFVLTELFDFWYLMSALPAYIFGTGVHYFISRRWVFSNTVRGSVFQGSMFFAVQSLGMVVNLSVLFVLVEYAGLWYILAKILTTVVAVSLNFNLNKYITFKQ